MVPSRQCRTAEHVSDGHPDKFCDQVADRILDEALTRASNLDERKAVRTAVECTAKNHLVLVTGEIKLPGDIRGKLDLAELVREVWCGIGYPEDEACLTVIDHLQAQSDEIALAADQQAAGDQGVMVGYATIETPEMMPREWVMARDLCLRLKELRTNGELPWLRPDSKSQVTLSHGGEVTSVILAAQHAEEISEEEVRERLLEGVVRPVVGDIPQDCVKVNGTGIFTVGGTVGDAGVVGRKIVIDAYGPRVPVGGGAYSGKDPTKVDRSAAYMARHIAKTAVTEGIEGAKECLVSLAYGIGQHQPEMVTAVADNGEDLSAWVKEHFTDLSPAHIIERLGLLKGEGWSYFQTASFGHYGRTRFPWEGAKRSSALGNVDERGIDGASGGDGKGGAPWRR